MIQSNMTFDKPMLACALLKPTDPHDDATILRTIQSLWRKKPGNRIATLKKDGIRGIVLGDLASRTLNKIPNGHLQSLSKSLPYGLDTELADLTLPYDQIESIVMSREHPDSYRIQFHIIDYWDEGKGIPYTERLAIAKHECQHFPCVVSSEPVECHTPEELFLFFKQCEQEEGEGICWRFPDSKYVQKGTTDNRSTLNEQYLIKLARFTRAEVTVIGFEEQQFNANPEKRNALGKMDRSSFKVGMIGKGVLGAFIVRNAAGLEFRIGTGVGLTDAKRAEIWDNQDKWLGETIVYKSKAHGTKLKPRSPIYVGKRNEIDIV